MLRFSLVRAGLLGVAGAVLTAATALASTTVVVARTADIELDVLAFGATTACGFPIELHTVGREVVISRYAGDRLVSQIVQVVYDGYLLNPVNGHSVPSRAVGPERTTYLADGTIVVDFAGATVRTVPGDGLVSGFIGRAHTVLAPTGEVDEEGYPVYDVIEESTAGQWLGNAGVCEALA